MDFSDNGYRERLRAMFHEHGAAGKGKVRVLLPGADPVGRDHGRLDRRLPGDTSRAQTVVLAGIGHLEYGSGIPKIAGTPYAAVSPEQDGFEVGHFFRKRCSLGRRSARGNFTVIIEETIQ